MFDGFCLILFYFFSLKLLSSTFLLSVVCNYWLLYCIHYLACCFIVCVNLVFCCCVYYLQSSEMVVVYHKFFLSLMLKCLLQLESSRGVWAVAEEFQCSRGFLQTLLQSSSSFASCLVHFTKVSVDHVTVM